MKIVAALPKTMLPDAEGLEFANERGFTRNHDNPKLAHLDELKRRLLSMGGWAVVLREQEPDLDAILSRGVLLSGDDAVQDIAEDSQCHFNSGMQHLLNPKGRAIMTGYALSEDGMWRQHSWIYDRDDDAVVETTEKRVGYFGVLLDDLEAITFCTRNVPYSPEAHELVSAHPAFSNFLASSEVQRPSES
ncbi:MAG TPA: hypothetical protein VGT98_10095 [Candidatus Elarobacter sp.]|nr:hypothetical protein [Candidatus Elarobacter sp.]HEV2739430.1 hypothetical protein [Candidatus Elarobacter sp.]